jgi:hypothetical protein
LEAVFCEELSSISGGESVVPAALAAGLNVCVDPEDTAAGIYERPTAVARRDLRLVKEIRYTIGLLNLAHHACGHGKVWRILRLALKQTLEALIGLQHHCRKSGRDHAQKKIGRWSERERDNPICIGHAKECEVGRAWWSGGTLGANLGALDADGAAHDDDFSSRSSLDDVAIGDDGAGCDKESGAALQGAVLPTHKHEHCGLPEKVNKVPVKRLPVWKRCW